MITITTINLINTINTTALVRLAKPTTTLTVLTSILQSFAFFNYTPERLLEKLPHTDGTSGGVQEQCCCETLCL